MPLEAKKDAGVNVNGDWWIRASPMIQFPSVKRFLWKFCSFFNVKSAKSFNNLMADCTCTCHAYVHARLSLDDVGYSTLGITLYLTPAAKPANGVRLIVKPVHFK